ncbi:hypothetical protein BY996DRAFT_211529 [Phakopsora pachyrhizi]|nr:hypothetical protein BY996DRAFT_211529 [Phakopsora pachyrhizi]
MKRKFQQTKRMLKDYLILFGLQLFVFSNLLNCEAVRANYYFNSTANCSLSFVAIDSNSKEIQEKMRGCKTKSNDNRYVCPIANCVGYPVCKDCLSLHYPKGNPNGYTFDKSEKRTTQKCNTMYVISLSTNKNSPHSL